MNSTNTESVSKLFHLGVALAGGFENFTCEPITKAQRWTVAKAIVEEFGIVAPRRNGDDLTVLGLLAITHACVEAVEKSIDPISGKAKGPRPMTPAQRNALVALYSGALVKKGLSSRTLEGLQSRGFVELSGPAAKLTDAGVRAAVAYGAKAAA